MAGDDDGTIRKQEEDYTTQVDDALPKAVAAATVWCGVLPAVAAGSCAVDRGQNLISKRLWFVHSGSRGGL